MKNIRLIFIGVILLSSLFGQIPINADLSPNETVGPYSFTLEETDEVIFYLDATSNTNWAEAGNESAVLTMFVDGDIVGYNQDIVIYNGDQLHTYKTMLGNLEAGDHTISFLFDYVKSSADADLIHLEEMYIFPAGSIYPQADVFKYSPILYGRDLFEWNESTRTDIPLIMWHEITNEGDNKRILYSMIFSNEDSRFGLGLAELMHSFGRTTDIEWVYEVLLDSDGTILEEIFQGPSHTTTEFNGTKIDLHPILKNVTLNCNFSDEGTSEYKFFLTPEYTLGELYTREVLMDDNPWTYKIMTEEMINEDKYEVPGDPATLTISDARNYLYIEFNGSVVGSGVKLTFGVDFFGSCDVFYSDHEDTSFTSGYGGGWDRQVIEMPEDFDLSLVKDLTLTTTSEDSFSMTISEISKLFILSEAYEPTQLEFQLETPIQLSSSAPVQTILIGNDDIDMDCDGVDFGDAFCDDCGVCAGGTTGVDPNADMDDCGVCFGNNEEMDCEDVCFGDSYLDDCEVCDDIPENDNECAGCLDPNAANFSFNCDGDLVADPTFDDGCCDYDNDDGVLIVPGEFPSIQIAINSAADGDTVLVSPGVYTEPINFSGKEIIVASTFLTIDDTSMIYQTILDGMNEDCPVTFESGETRLSRLMGFRIENGYGKGVSFEEFVVNVSDPEAFEAMLVNDIRAGAVSCINSSPTLEYLIISNNTARNVAGGVGFVNSNAILKNSVVKFNDIPEGAAAGGGGIGINGGSPEVENVLITGNTVGTNILNIAGGGGILCGFSFDENNIIHLKLKNVRISHNEGVLGGAIGMLSGTLEGDRLLIHSNDGYLGSALSLGEPYGLIVDDISVLLTNSTITQNTTLTNSVITLHDYASLTIINSIVWNEEVANEIASMPSNTILDVHPFYSDIRNGWEGEGNIDSDPLFTVPEYYEFTLSENSPCIDMGTPFFVFEGDTLINMDSEEFEGNAPDMGFFESPYTVSINDEASLLDKFVLHQNYPNPFNPITTIRFNTIETLHATSLHIFNTKGQLIETLVNKQLSPGYHKVRWDASHVASGVYIYRLVTGNNVITKKMVLLK